MVIRMAKEGTIGTKALKFTRGTLVKQRGRDGDECIPTIKDLLERALSG